LSAVPPDDAATLEREYRAHRDAVVGMLRSEFPPLWNEVEELYQHSWAEVLAIRARGETIENLRALLKRIAWNSARDLYEKHQPDYLDPASVVLQRAVDRDMPPDE